MKSKPGFDKLRGGYYTPGEIAKFICDWAIQKENVQVLEPSCGDGVFIEASINRLREFGPDINYENYITGIELIEEEAKKSEKYGARIINGDFFEYYSKYIKNKMKYDVIVGNPPFIRYQNVDETSREIAFSFMKEIGLSPTKLTNMWLPFLVLSSLSLKKNGRLGMVIPAELFQVDYAGETRQFLSTYFEKITIVTFRTLVFDEIQQEVVLLLCEINSKDKGIQVLELNGIDDLLTTGITTIQKSEIKELDHTKEKWVKYYLSNDEIKLMRELQTKAEIKKTTDLFETNVGLVSGENNFFLMNKDTVDKFDIGQSAKKVIGRSEQMKGVLLNHSDFDDLVEKKKRVFIFMPEKVPLKELGKPERKYIQYGEEQGFNTGYKCRIRKLWYCIPQSWEPDAFIIRQANRFPRIVLNNINAVSTDTVHKIKFLQGVNEKQVTAAFLNSFTLALAEITGRSYGGGVLTFEPGEIRKLMIPMKCAEKLDIDKIDQLMRDNRIEEILDYTDCILLQEGLGLSTEEVTMLRNIWLKLSERRLGRKEQKNSSL